MNSFKEKLNDFANTVEEVDQKLIPRIFDTYKKIPKKWRNLSKLLKKLKEENQHLFSTNIISKKIISESEQNANKRKILDEGNKNWQLLKKAIPASLGDKKIKKILKKVEQLFPAKFYKHSHRVKNRARLLENIKINSDWAKTDLVGLRIVPKQSNIFPQVIRKFEKKFGDDIVFKLNLFLKQNKKTTRVRKSSDYYYAINYYFAIRPFFMEVQIRTPAVDLWSDLTHDSIYKHKVKINFLLKQYLNKFGKICGIVDFFEIVSLQKDLPSLNTKKYTSCKL